MTFRFEIDSVKNAYLFLKSYVYHENLNLFLKKRVAEFECDSFNEKIALIYESMMSEDFQRNKNWQEWIGKIDYNLLPKGVVFEDVEVKSNGLFLTNERRSDNNKTKIKKINYFIDAPVEIHIIDVLWTIIVGPDFESELSNDCYGNRLSEMAIKFVKQESYSGVKAREIFKRYIDQYNSWRDKAIDCATRYAGKGEDVAILSLDLQSYYYHVEINFDSIIKRLTESSDRSSLDKLKLVLTKALKNIFEMYREKIRESLSVSHPKCNNILGLPIGLTSSALLANWYLRDFDISMSKEVRPVFYGRYVDDILVVIKRPVFEKNNPIDDFIKKYFKGVLKKKGKEYCISNIEKKDSITIQDEKLILHYFSKENSLAGLRLFKQEIENRSSAFKFLPDEHVYEELDKYAYDIIYDGSINKFRSIIGFAENETELSRYISSHIIAHRLCKLDKKEQVIPHLKLFFNGGNVIKFSRFWEKVYQYSIVIKRFDFIKEFNEKIIEEIDNVFFSEPVRDVDSKIGLLTEKIKKDLKLYNEISLSLCTSLLDSNDSYFKRTEMSKSFRDSNLIRHHLVAWPLANFTDYDGDLTDEEAFRNGEKSEINGTKLDNSPRFIHFDEFQLYYLNYYFHEKNEESGLGAWHEEVTKKYQNKISLWRDETPIVFEKAKKFKKISSSWLKIRDSSKVDTIKVGIANLAISIDDIQRSVRTDKKPNISFGRQLKLHQLLNDATREKIDLLIMPEVSIPVSWLPFMVSHARRHQIGIIFGLEYWVVNGVAYNLIIEALPFKFSEKYNSCMMTARVKNHYAPAEMDLLDSVRIGYPSNLEKKHLYHKVSWKNISLATYNCFELSDIEHRAIFKSQLDLMIACVWNKDTNYYQHIIESVVRDIHCYVIQANTSQYGGSCILQPSKTDTKTVLYVKGGDNTCLLTTKLNIKELRDFQFKSKANNVDKFKPVPPGYDCESVKKR